MGYPSAALDSAALTYLKAHFTEGVAAVFSPKEGSDHYVVQIVANKYNPTNFWYVPFLYVVSLYSQHHFRSGRWRSEYTINMTTKEVSGKILINIHYYEQGNVQSCSIA